jgi:hypothetical protein
MDNSTWIFIKMKRSRDTKIDFLEKENVTIHPRCTATRNTPFLPSSNHYT